MNTNNSNAKHFVGHNFVTQVYTCMGIYILYKWLYFTSVWIICMPLMPVVIRDIEKNSSIGKLTLISCMHMHVQLLRQKKRILLITMLFLTSVLLVYYMIQHLKWPA